MRMLIAVAIFSGWNAHAGIVNGGFEEGGIHGPEGWISSGYAQIKDIDSFEPAPVEGSRQAMIATLSSVGCCGDDEEIIPGLPLRKLNEFYAANLPGEGTIKRGSFLSQNISVSQGELLAFSYNFFPSSTKNPVFNDFAFFSVGDEIFLLADTWYDFIRGEGYRNPQTGYLSFQHQFTASGNYEIGFGVVGPDFIDVSSVLLIDNVTLKVSAPAGIGLLNLSVAMLMLCRSRMGRFGCAQ